MDGVIPRTRLPEVLRRIDRIVATHALRVGNVFHAGDGNLHPNILYDPRIPGEEERVLAAGAEIMRACVDVGGTISGEHGIGLEKRDFMPWIFSEADLGDDGRGQGGVQSHRALQPRQGVPDAEVVRPGRDRLPAASPRGERADPAPLTRAPARPPRMSTPLLRSLAEIVGRGPLSARRRSRAVRRRRPHAVRGRLPRLGRGGGARGAGRRRRRRSPWSRGAAGPRCIAGRRPGTARSSWGSGASTRSSSTSRATSRPPSRRGSRSPRSRARSGRGVSGCRSIPPAPERGDARRRPRGQHRRPAAAALRDRAGPRHRHPRRGGRRRSWSAPGARS